MSKALGMVATVLAGCSPFIHDWVRDGGYQVIAPPSAELSPGTIFAAKPTPASPRSRRWRRP
jgi:hypothetical protein